MVKRIIPLACALVLAWCAGARAAPAVNIWGCEVTRIWPTAASGLAADTLARFGTASTGDSVSTTDAVNVFGARYILLVALSSGTDTLYTPVLQSQLPGASAWTGTGGIFFLPYSGFSPATLNGNTVTSSGKAIWGVFNETTIAGSTPLPMVNTSFRWRVKSADARRYSAPSSATLAATGSITIYALVWR